jgi:hypothetical protein
MTRVAATGGKILLLLFFFSLIYIIILIRPHPFFGHAFEIGNITVYSTEDIPAREMTAISQEAMKRVEKSSIYLPMKHEFFIVNHPYLWVFLANRNRGASGLNYTIFNHNVFLRKADIKKNQLFGASGKPARGDRTLAYFMAHEMTHTFEFHAMPWYKYPINTNWILEGYAEYVAHGSEPYEKALDRYLNVRENKGEKYYTRVRTMIAYLLEKEHASVPGLWERVGEYDAVLKKAIPDDRPLMDK